jgi:hypothetical protein
MDLSVEALWKMSDRALIAAYHAIRRRYIEAKFGRDDRAAARRAPRD